MNEIVPSKSLFALVVLLSACSATSLYPDDIEPWDAGALDAGAEEAPPPGPPVVATDIALTEVALLQGVKIPLMKDGSAAKSDYASIVAGRPGLLRVHVKPLTGFRSREVIAELSLKSEANVVTVRQVKMTVKKASVDTQLESTMNFTIGAEDISNKNFSFNVRLLAVPPKTPIEGPPAQYPSDLSYATAQPVSSSKLRIVIVPVRYDADGSGRLPVTDATMIEQYRKAFFEMYPVTAVDITVRDSIAWSSAIKPDRSGWSEVLNEVIALRSKDQPAEDVYYVGTFAPAESFGKYCRDGCTAGLATLVTNSADSNLRAGVAVGFDGEYSALAAVHETGHLHGRKHAPCGSPANVDKAFPYADGYIGSLGYGILDKELYGSFEYSDFMGYCQANWVSDYTYASLLKRIQAVTPLQKSIALPGAEYRFIQIGSDETLRWGPTIKFRTAPSNNPTMVRIVDGSGVWRNIVGHYYPYGDDEGGVMVVRKSDASGGRVEIDLGGKTRVLGAGIK